MLEPLTKEQVIRAALAVTPEFEAKIEKQRKKFKWKIISSKQRSHTSK